VGVGRLVFKVLNRVEAALAAAMIIAWVFSAQNVPPVAGALLILAMVALASQLLVLRPAMAARTKALAGSAMKNDGGAPVKGNVASSTHIAYIGAELVKVVALPIAGAGIVLNVITLGS